MNKWRSEAEKNGRTIQRIAVAFETGHDGFWLARWLAFHGIESHVIHATSVAVTREHRRAKTDRLDTEMLKRGFLGWLRGERGHCKMVAVPTLAEEDAKRPSREREVLVAEASRIITRIKAAFVRLGIRKFNPAHKEAREQVNLLLTPDGAPIPPNTLAALKRDLDRHRFVKAQIHEIESDRLERLANAPSAGSNAMVSLVPAAHRGGAGNAQDPDCGVGAQAAHRFVAVGARWRCAGWCSSAASRLVITFAEVP